MATRIVSIGVLLLAGSAAAENFDYEVGGAYVRTESDFSNDLGFASIRGSSDADSLGLFGTWYLNGLSDEKGPRARAAFLSRASELTVAFAHVDGSFSSTATDPIGPPVVVRGDSTTDNLAANLRFVWEDSDWYGLAGLSHVQSDFEADNVIGSVDIETTAYAAGLGRYFGPATAVDLNVIWTDTDGTDPVAVALNFTHLGALGDAWQYALDVGLSQSDQDDDDGTYGLRFSLYPSRDFEFGVALTHQEGGLLDGNLYEGFLSWFARPNVALSVSHSQDDFDTLPGEDLEGSATEIGVSIRF